MRYFTRVQGLTHEFRFERRGDELLAHCEGRTVSLDLALVGDGQAFSLLADGRNHDVFVENGQGAVVVTLRGQRIRVEVEDERERVAHSLHAHKPGGRREIRAVMPGIVVALLVKEGDQVKDGQTLAVLEAMKMQNPIGADGSGKVVKIHAREGVAVAAGAVLVELE